MEVCNSNMRIELAYWIIFIGSCGVGILYLTLLIDGLWSSRNRNSWLLEAIKKNSRAAVGLPLIGITATFVISIFQTTSGAIKFKGLGFEFEGASGPIVLWCLCFLILTLCLKLLWDS